MSVHNWEDKVYPGLIQKILNKYIFADKMVSQLPELLGHPHFISELGVVVTITPAKSNMDDGQKEAVKKFFGQACDSHLLMIHPPHHEWILCASMGFRMVDGYPNPLPIKTASMYGTGPALNEFMFKARLINLYNAETIEQIAVNQARAAIVLDIEGKKKFLAAEMAKKLSIEQEIINLEAKLNSGIFR